MVVGGFTVPAALVSSTPMVICPCPSAKKVPVRARGVALKPPVKTSPLDTKAYWPFKLARLYFPAGGGGVTMAMGPLPAAVQRAAATVRPKTTRFIAHLAALLSGTATLLGRATSGSLCYCVRRRPAFL